MRHLLAALIAIVALQAPAYGQDDWRDALRQWMTADDMEESYGEEAMELLEELAANPLNLNQASREDLEQLPFLSAQAVEGLVSYLDRHRPMRSLSELRMIVALDYEARELLTFFVCCGDAPAPTRHRPTVAEVLKGGSHQLMATARIPFYQRRGDTDGYLGYRYRHDVRYQFNYQNRVKFGLTGAQDAGEPFFSGRNAWGYDHYAIYLQLRDMGRLEELNIGTYRVQMGLGLLMNTGFHLGKLATLQSLGGSRHTLTAHSSRTQSGFMQGAAATVRLGGQWRATAFASYRAIDATLNADGTIRTLLKDGYHRTAAEMARKHNSHQADVGGSVGWRRGTLYVNANAVYTHFDRRLNPDQDGTLYRRYAAAGNNMLNASVDYGYNNYRWAMSGETAINRQGALAALHTVSCKVSDGLSMMLLHRYYDKRYTALHARSFSEGSAVQNEHGVYLGLTWQPGRYWTLRGYADYAHFAWPRYQVSASSDAADMLLSARYSRQRWTLDARYRLHIRQQDNADKTALVNKTEHRVRLAAAVSATPQLTLRTQADGMAVVNKSGSKRGIMVSQHGVWKGRRLKADGLVGWFHTDDYDSRIYQYEPSVRYDFSFPMYYGHGIRYSLLLSADIGRRLQAMARVGVTNYFDRSVIGSGLQQINHSSMTDLTLQLRYRF